MPMTFNGRSLSSFGLAMMPPLDNWFHTPRVDRQSTPIVDHHAARPNPRATTEPRDMLIHAMLRADTVPELEAKTHAISDWLTGLVRIVRMDSPTTLVRAEYLGAEQSAFSSNSHFTLPARKLAMLFRAYDAASYDISPQIIALGTTPVPIVVGTLPSAGIITWPGGWSGTRTITYRGANGIVYGTMSLTVPGAVTFAAGDHVRLDLARWRATLVTAAGVRSNVYSWLSAGDWFVTDATDADRTRSMYPALSVSAGTAQYRHRLAWKF